MLPGVACLVVFLVWAGDQGGYPPTVWYAGALVLAALLVTLVFARGSAFLGSPRVSWWAIAFFAAFTAWSFMSISWASSKGDAWDGANRTLLYLLVYALFARWPWRPAGAALLLGLHAAGVVAIGLLTLHEVAGSSHATTYFIGSRLSEPLGYPNATAALFLIAFWPAVFLASSRHVTPLLRGLLLGIATALLELSIIPQSRGALLSLPVAALLYLVLVPGRLRSLLHLALVGGAAALALNPLLDVYRTGARGGDIAAATAHARNIVVISLLVLTAVGVAVALGDRRLELSPRIVNWANRAVGGLALVGAVVGLAVVLALGSPGEHARNVWHNFKSPEPGAASSHFVGLGSNRYDFYRVSLLTLERHPVGGAGADNFGIEYLRERRSGEQPLYTHSLELRLLAHTGVVGAALFAGFLAAALLAAWRSRSRGEVFKRGTAAAATVAFGYWLIHGSGDWLWEFPALGAAAFAWLGLSTGLERRSVPVVPGLSKAAMWAVGGVTTIAALGAALTLGLPWLAAREVDYAAHSWRADPQSAFDSLGRARRLNPLSDFPDLIAGAIAGRLGDNEKMRLGYSRAIARNPDNWYSRLELGVLYGIEHKYPAALRELRQAQALNPREPLVALALRRVKRHRPVNPAAVDRILLDRARATTR
jgi:O-Antigen ligase